MKVKFHGVTFGAMILGSCALLVSCTAKVEEKSGPDTAATASADTVATPPARTDMSMTPPPPAAPTLTDANIFAKLDAANSMEVMEGQTAQQKGKSADVKSFGKMMVTDHGKMKQEGAALAKKLNITPEPPADASDKAMMMQMWDQIKALSGAAFDSAYIAHQVDGHQKTLNDLTMMMGQAQNDSLKTMIQGAIPKVQAHLDHAREIQGKLTAVVSSGTTGTTGTGTTASSDTPKAAGKK